MAVCAQERDTVLSASVRTAADAMEIDTFRSARPDDADAIAQLVNQAFRPRNDAAGWTHEAHLVAGDRIDPAQVLRVLAADDTALLLGMAGDEIAACVQIERAGDSARIGMLAVDTDRQGAGLGKAMLAQAEAHAVQRWQVEKFVMRVLSARVELLDFYRRRGYRRSGEVSDYPVSAAGVPLQAELKIETLEKDVQVGVW